VCGDDPEIKRDPWGAWDSYYGDRVGGEGGRDSQGGRLTTEATTRITIGILEYWNCGMMGKEYKPRNQIFFDLPKIPLFHHSMDFIEGLIDGNNSKH
jgi:hypothetical protein